MPANEHESEPSGQALPAGTRIEEFVIERVLGSGGFGITYLARDAALGRKVVIKENLPAQFAFRDPSTLTVAPRHTHGEDMENFRWSLENFSKEAAMLASLDHPGIVRVHRSFQALGTAYFVMPFVEGVAFDALIESRRTKGQPFSEAELRGLLEHTLTALDHLHDRGIYHRDIKPANILITNDGVPVLIDFGSARQRLSERSMTVVESAGYTPFEQLQSRGNVGPWSDLYALGGTLVKALTFESMPKAADRVFDDPFVPLAGRADLQAAYGNGLLASVDKALAVQSQNRHQHAGEWVAALRGNIAAISVTPAPASSPSPPAPEGFALIPAGEFQMGDALDGMKDAPLHTVHVSAFFIAKHEVTKALWHEVLAWGQKNGYAVWFSTFITVGNGKAANHPVHSVSWHDVVKWCNARSEREGQVPCYWVGGAVYRTGKRDDVLCKWGSNGYRLPTEAEWEKAARGGLSGKRFPWGDTISHEQANFSNVGKEVYRNGSTCYHPAYKTDGMPYTSPVGSFAANGYGLYDMAGNVSEWCWDWHGGYSATMQTDPRGPVSGSYRVFRGGSWNDDASFTRCAYRGNDWPNYANRFIGFRLARGQP
jgi:formylglycine-generating enzyme required for sulfatase activity/predicted Ser/Thr protein kinase